MSIVATSLAYSHPNKEVLFQNLHFSVPKGAKASLVGNNGVGKSTLLQLLAGRVPPASGEVLLAERPYYVPQHLGQYDAYTVAQAMGVAEQLQALQAILAGEATAENFSRLNEAWDLEERVQAALSFWHLQHLGLSQPLHELSGGEKTKVFLAGALVHAPAIILLDEPSNHLDAESRQLLHDFIGRSKATILVVSHDRALLNLVNLTLELTPTAVEVYGGCYSFYREQKDARLAALHAQLDDKEKTLHHAQQKARDVAEQRHKQEARGKAQGLKKALPRIVAGGLKSKAQQSSAKLKEAHADKINGITQELHQIRGQLQEHQILKIDLAKSDLHRGKTLIEARAINFTYGQEPLWQKPLSFQVRSGDRMRLAGRNGAGKSTLLKLMTGSLTPTNGKIFVADFEYFYIDQDYSLLDNGLTVFEQVQHFNSRGLLEHELKTVLHYQQFPREAWDRQCAGLSGGEKLKLLLCCLIVRNNAPDVLILDEPTNNLDVHSQEVLTAAIKDFGGSILLISHDQYFVEAIGVDVTLELA
ncbi:ABC-F family ATP-binding cassette domain-containing protein [Hymenobacter taeanensis]|uniref:ABC-F family ATP-binding cassette domain-containing protein n=1 Tax=Hymenobacter taeanensis TaxID=2735321 RepID=A0A6M6BDB6_9BACT|nr:MULTISPECIES: ABC-F family ATP-binding cassette domain-containing protein [Hymenobacter]QJX45828.1 ABC-F family ATP-binding cassette domain-containing protein [Hymenobacter taeanensis]UOQ79671.1 ATP-binding cassette domain-containing protein [Hymenobacter sp. 5414T-23]